MSPITRAEAAAAMAAVCGDEEVVAVTGDPHVVVETAAGSQQRAFVKTLEPGADDWRAEADAYESGVLISLVDGLRAPRLYKVVSLEGGGVRLWLEDVVTTDLEWTSDRLVEVAGLLGRMSRLYLAMDENPPLPLRESSAAGVATSFGHGNARRSNFLAEGADPHRFVLVDWGKAGWWPVGSDLAPLLSGDPNSPEDEALAAFCEAGFDPEAVAAGYREALAMLDRA
ncbi:MAG: phosphotransferase [Acidimicrobiia bacterium]